MPNNENGFAFIHVRPGIDSKEQPVATIAISLVPEFDQIPGLQRYAVGFAAQHTKKDGWNAAMGRTVAQGRAERSASRVFVHAADIGRRDLLIAAVTRVLEAVEANEIFATKQTTRALQNTLARLVESAHLSQSKHVDQAAE